MGHGADMLTMVAAAKALVEAGKSPRDIADALDISIAAARYHSRKYRAPKPPEVILSDDDVSSMLADPARTLGMLAASGVKFTGVPDNTVLWLDDRFTHSEIAAALNVSAGSVKSRCKRVRDRHNVKPNNGAGKVIGGRRVSPLVRESKPEASVTLKMCDAEAAIRKQIDERRAEIDEIRCARIVHARRIEAAREELRKVELELAAEREAFDRDFGADVPEDTDATDAHLADSSEIPTPQRKRKRYRYFQMLTRAEWDCLFDQALRNPPKKIIRILDGEKQRVPNTFTFPEATSA